MPNKTTPQPSPNAALALGLAPKTEEMLVVELVGEFIESNTWL